MDIRKHESWLNIGIEHYLDAIEAEGFEAVAATCAQAGRAGLERFLARHEKMLNGMLHTAGNAHSSPSLQAGSRTRHHLGLIAVSWRLRCALCYLQAMENMLALPQSDLHPGDFAWQAALAADRIEGGYPDYWPFEDYPDPFGLGRPVHAWRSS